MTLSEREVLQLPNKARLARVGERLLDHQYKALSAFSGILINTFVSSAAAKSLQEQTFYLALAVAIGTVADITARGDKRSLSVSPKNVGQ